MIAYTSITKVVELSKLSLCAYFLPVGWCYFKLDDTWTHLQFDVVIWGEYYDHPKMTYVVTTCTTNIHAQYYDYCAWYSTVIGREQLCFLFLSIHTELSTLTRGQLLELMLNWFLQVSVFMISYIIVEMIPACNSV